MHRYKFAQRILKAYKAGLSDQCAGGLTQSPLLLSPKLCVTKTISFIRFVAA